MGRIAGGRVFGYDNVNIYPSGADPRTATRMHIVREINEAQAAVVRRIFTLYDSGAGLKRIAMQLNGESAPRPKPFVRKDPTKVCADFKGEFQLTDRRYCVPLTITDFASRYLICCEALASTKAPQVFTVFERAFQEFGLPLAIRTDNGLPFGCGKALYGRTRLSICWLRVGIGIERIKPGHPEQNGRHERMHLTLKREATKPASPNFLQQQARFEAFVARYNDERPHAALAMRVPAGLRPLTVAVARHRRARVSVS